MRTNNSIKNIIVALFSNIIIILIGFISQKVFIITLGKEYLGLNGLFSNILSILSVVELGFGSAIIFHLYTPIAENDENKINLLLNLYKKTYRLISGIIFILGICLLPFIYKIVGKISITDNLYLLFFLALLEIVVSYLLTYKRSILYADQKTYIINIVHALYTLFLNITEIVLLLKTNSYILYLVVKIIFRIIENVVITIIANKKYSFIKQKPKGSISSELKKDIFTKVKGLLLHTIASALVLSTDNLIISKLFGVVIVGLYSNYYMIINAINVLISQAFNSITATIGNLLIENNKEKSYEVYKNILFFNSWIYCITGTCLLCLMEPFISIWIGKDFILPTSILVTLVVNYYIQGMRKTNARFKEAAGIFYEDRFIPIIESIINLILSIILGKIFGLIGVFIGTICSALVLYLYSYPIFVYKRLFNQSYKNFLIKHLYYLFISNISAIIAFFGCKFITINNIYLKMIICLIISITLPSIIYYIFFRNSNEFKYYKNLILKIFLKFKEKGSHYE